MRLGDLSTRRDENNLNLIRFLAAGAVLASHAWPISQGPQAVEPLKQLTGHSLGGMAVYVFFAISGFLVTSSFLRSPSRADFLLARGLRLFPALCVALLLVTFVMGAGVTTLPLGAYLSDPGTIGAFLRNITLAFPQYTLPGVFEANPYPTVQGSIWTLIHEVLCYGLVFLAGVAGLLGRRRAMAVAILAWLVGGALAGGGWLPVPGRLVQTFHLSFPFVIGMAFWIWRDRLVLSLPLVLILAGLAAGTRGTALGSPLLVLTITYATFWCAYVPKGRIRTFNRLGDYSYGIYLYAFPIQGLVVWLAAGMGATMTPWTNIALAFPLTLFCAVLSWHLVEQPALSLRRWGSRKEPAHQPDLQPG